jgi:NitT/TauT family transport system substrate-binding protein
MQRSIRRRVSLSVSTSIVSALLITGCSAPAPGPTPPTEISGEIDLTGETIRITVPSAEALTSNLFYMLDLLEAWGAKVDRIELVSTNGVQALLAGQTDLVAAPSDEAVLGAANDLDVVGIASQRATMDYVLAAQRSIDSVADLEGKNIGISGPAGFDALLGRLTLAKNGVDAGDVNFVQIGSSGDRAASLVGGRIDAATILLSDWLVLSNQTDKVKDLARMSDELADFPKELIFGSRDYFDAHEQVGLAVACANLEANRWFADDREGWIAYTRALVPTLGEEDAQQLYDTVAEMNMFPTNAAQLVVAEGLQGLADAMLENGDITGSVDAAALVEHRFLDEAAAMGCGAA